MLVKINQEIFNSCDDEDLISQCMMPTILQIRGKDFETKNKVYTELNKGQKALMMFQVIFGHSRSGILEFFRIIPYLPSGKGIWQQLENAMVYFHDQTMYQLFQKLEEIYIDLENTSFAINSGHMDIFECLDNKSELYQTIVQYNDLYIKNIPNTVKLIAQYIRSFPNEFVELK